MRQSIKKEKKEIWRGKNRERNDGEVKKLNVIGRGWWSKY